MSPKGGVTQKGNPILAKDHPGRIYTPVAKELSSPAKVARLPPPAKSASSRPRLWEYAVQQVASKSASNQIGGRRFADKETRKVSSSSETNVSGYNGESNTRTSMISQVGPGNKASRQFDQRQRSSASLFQTAAENDRVQLHQKSNGASAKSVVVGKPEKKAVSSDLLAKGSSDNYKNFYVHNSANLLCKQCRSSLLESVCFISNEGRIAAVRTGASVRHLHVCDSPRCAANPNYKPSLAESKKFVVSRRQSLPSQFSRNKSRAPSCLGRVGSSSNSSLHGDDSPRYSVASPFPNSRKRDKEAEELNHRAGTAAIDQNIHGEDEWNHNAGAESNCGTPIEDQNGYNSCGSSDLRLTSVRGSEDEQGARGSDRESVSECSTPAAHENSASVIGSQDQKSSRQKASSRPEAGVLESRFCILVSQENGQSWGFTRVFENEQSSGGNNRRFGSDEGAVLADEISTSIDGSKDQKTCCSPAPAYENSGLNDESRDQQSCSEETGELDKQDQRASTRLMRDCGDERSCGGSNTGFGSECSTSTFSHENSATICSSQEHDQKRCRDEEGNLESCCSTPLGYDSGLTGTSGSFYHQDKDELSCSDDDREETMRDDTFSTVSTSPGSANTSLEQSSKKMQRKKSSVSRLRRNYLNLLKEQEAETVRLRKQEIQKRKQAGDWMLDCAIEEVLHRLAPNGETRVKILVEAFETVMSHSDSETYVHPTMNF